MDVTPGKYRHYKGKDYNVLGISTHSETLEKLVVYHPLYGDQALWVRPINMFLELVEAKGNLVPRFQRL